MSFEIRSGRYYAAFWIVEAQDGSGNVNAAVWRDLPNGPWHMQYRFRYYVDNKAHDSKDRRSWFIGQARGEQTEEQAVANGDKLVCALIECGYARRQDVTCLRLSTDDPKKIAEALTSQPSMHGRALGPDA